MKRLLTNLAQTVGKSWGRCEAQREDGVRCVRAATFDIHHAKASLTKRVCTQHAEAHVQFVKGGVAYLDGKGSLDGTGWVYAGAKPKAEYERLKAKFGGKQ